MGNAQVPVWVLALAALLTPTVAIAGVYIARQQWLTNRNKLKLELFEKRYVYYDAAMELISNILTSGVATNARNFDFLIKTKGAQFMVGQEIADYLDALYRKAVLLETLGTEFKGLEPGAERTGILKQEREIKDWMQEQFKVLDAKFSGMLRLSH